MTGRLVPVPRHRSGAVSEGGFIPSGTNQGGNPKKLSTVQSGVSLLALGLVKMLTRQG